MSEIEKHRVEKLIERRQRERTAINLEIKNLRCELKSIKKRLSTQRNN